MREHQIEYLGSNFVNFHDHSFRWVHLKHFRVPAAAAAEDALAMLIAHVRYRDHYATADSDEHPTDDIHGPYRLDRISRASFESVDEQTALKAIQDFAEDTHPEIVDRLERDVYAAIRAMPVRYLLKDLGRDAFHEWGGVLHDFHELVLLGPSERRLLLVVAAID